MAVSLKLTFVVLKTYWSGSLRLKVSLLLDACLIVVPMLCSAQETEPALKHSTLGVGLKFSSLGVGFDTALPVTSRSNVRLGVNIFNYSRDDSAGGVTYKGTVRFRSVQTSYDWFPWGGSFHISPGVLIHNGNRVRALASVPGGGVFSLHETDYQSSPSDPVHGNADIDFHPVAPLLLVGWGNLIPRRQKRFVIPFEVGIVYHGTPNTLLNFAGTACDQSGLDCRDISIDPRIQSDIEFERSQLRRDVSSFKVYPIVSIGFALNF